MLKMKFLPMIAVAATAASALFGQAPQQSAPAPATTTSASEAVPDGGVPKYLKPETPEQRKARLGIPEDPGTNPDPNKHYWRYGYSYHIEKFDRQWSSYVDVDPGFVRPFAYVNATNEVYQQNDKYVWVWVRDVAPEELEPPKSSKYSNEQLQYFEDMRSEFSDLTPKPAGKTIRFTKASEGLPTSGSWRNSLAVADMNGDGCPDIIAPPERKGRGTPVIFLGDCKGHWHQWTNVQWPIQLDYGNVVAADFNKDGHMDLAFAVHQVGVFVMLGDGKGVFRLSSQGLPRDYATRRVAVADVDHDGYPDIIAISEGVSGASSRPVGKIRVYLNREKGKVWQGADVAASERPVAGDWLTVAHLNGDSAPDVIASSIYMNSNDVIFLSDGTKKWKPLAADARLIPTLGYYYANTAGKFTSKKRDDALLSYVRFWPADVESSFVPNPTNRAVVGIDRLSFADDKPRRTPIARWAGNRPVLGMAAGDFDGDGNLDIVYTRHDPREAVILLGDGKGGFTRANVEGLVLDPLTNYDVTVADVNGDGKPDVIVMYESSASTVLAPQNGSIQVFLNRGTISAVTAAKK